MHVDELEQARDLIEQAYAIDPSHETLAARHAADRKLMRARQACDLEVQKDIDRLLRAAPETRGGYRKATATAQQKLLLARQAAELELQDYDERQEFLVATDGRHDERAREGFVC